MTTTERTLKYLTDHAKTGVTRRELTWQLFGIWTLSHDRQARAAIASLQKLGRDVISHDGRYYLMTADTPLHVMLDYTDLEKRKAATTLRRMRLLRKRFDELHNGKLA